MITEERLAEIEAQPFAYGFLVTEKRELVRGYRKMLRAEALREWDARTVELQVMANLEKQNG